MRWSIKLGRYPRWRSKNEVGPKLLDAFYGCTATCFWVNSGKKCGGTRAPKLPDQIIVDAAAEAALKRRTSYDIRRCKEDKGTNCKKVAEAAAKIRASALKAK
jgi:hypothetical protein